MSITTNIERIGNFTSSAIVKLFSEPTAAAKKGGAIFGKGALTYIKERNHERRLGRSLDDEKRAKPLLWGKLLEKRVFELLPISYTVAGDVTDVHPTINYWSGSADAFKDSKETVCDIKCPFTLSSFCDLVQPLYDGFEGMEAMNIIRETHTDGEKYYWQIVSNSIINSSIFGELIVYMPYKSELEEIKMSVIDDPEYGWVKWALDDELPFLIEDNFYKNLNIIRFEIPQSDKDLLAKRVLEAGKLLINNEPNNSTLIPEINGDLTVTTIEPSDILQKLQKI